MIERIRRGAVRRMDALPMRRTALRIRALDARLRELEQEHSRLSSRVAALTTRAGDARAAAPAADAGHESGHSAPVVEAAWGSAIALYEHRIAALERRRFGRAS